MPFWYTIDVPRNRPCWEINPRLWAGFVRAMQDTHGFTPEQDEIYTEEYVVQRMDMDATVTVWSDADASQRSR